MKENKLSTISQVSTLEEMSRFWNDHDFTKLNTDIPNVEFTIPRSIALAYTEQRARRGSREKFDTVLDKVAQADLEPLPEDRLPSTN